MEYQLIHKLRVIIRLKLETAKLNCPERRFYFLVVQMEQFAKNSFK